MLAEMQFKSVQRKLINTSDQHRLSPILVWLMTTSAANSSICWALSGPGSSSALTPEGLEPSGVGHSR